MSMNFDFFLLFYDIILIVLWCRIGLHEKRSQHKQRPNKKKNNKKTKKRESVVFSPQANRNLWCRMIIMVLNTHTFAHTNRTRAHKHEHTPHTRGGDSHGVLLFLLFGRSWVRSRRVCVRLASRAKNVAPRSHGLTQCGYSWTRCATLKRGNPIREHTMGPHAFRVQFSMKEFRYVISVFGISCLRDISSDHILFFFDRLFFGVLPWN